MLPSELRSLPIVCYFHENQLTYPLPDEADRDYQYGFTNITTCLVADRLWFNSQYHLGSFCQAADTLLSRMPDHVPEAVSERVRNKTEVLHPGISWIGPGHTDRARNDPFTILWNHRWEYDKNPDEFFEVLFDLADRNVAFRLIVAGEQFRTCPPIFDRAKGLLADRIVYWGYAESRRHYRRLLQSADIALSTAIHEFFGLSVLEAVSAGCFALLPERLSYPELLARCPAAARFYRSREELVEVLCELLTGEGLPKRATVAAQIRHFDWAHRIGGFDDAFESIAGKSALG